jgi:DNA-binding CsgD family transcriptional regulator
MDLIYRRNGLHKEADKLIIELIKMSKKRKSNQTLASFYIIQASESLNKKKLDTARIKLDSVTKYIELTKDHDIKKKDTYLANILSLRYHLEKKQIDSADYYYNALIDLENKQLKFIYLIAQANSTKVSYLKTKNRISEALELLHRYKNQNAIGQDTNYNDLEVEKLYAELYNEQNQSEKAIIHYKKYIDIKNQLDKQVTQNAYAYYQARFNTTSKEKEILQQQTEILQLENEKTIASNKRNSIFFVLCLGVLCMVSIGYFMFQKERSKRKRVAKKLVSNERELALFTERLLQKSKEQESLFKEIDYLKNEIGEKVSILNLQELASSKILTMDDWYTFKQKFIAVYPLFFLRIEKQKYKLTKSEERLVALEKLGLTSHEIANLLGISFDSVNTNRYRLRKKINAPKEIPIVDYLEKDNLQEQFSDSQ